MTNINPNALARRIMEAIDNLNRYDGPYGRDRLVQCVENTIKGFLKKRKPRARKGKRK